METVRYTLMHISDLHTGWHFDLRVAEQLAHQAHEIQPNLLVISGDLVLRSDLVAQWHTIMAYLKMLPQPQLIVPGNHDVSLFNGYYRLMFPLKRYRRYISDTLNPVFTLPGLAVVGGCTAHGLTIDGGRLSAKQLKTLDTELAQFGPDTCKLLVLHHHVVEPPGVKPRRKISNKNDALRLMDRHQVDLFLCGHVHMSYVGTTNGVLPDVQHRTIISQCGTSTSRRGRGTDRRKNSFHLIDIDDKTIGITQHFYDPDAGRFVQHGEHIFNRQGS